MGACWGGSTVIRARSRRGVALLVVLAALVVSTSAVVALSGVALGSRLAASARRDSVLADRLRDAADAPILDWLRRHAGRVVLPPDALSPRFLVLDDAVELGGERARLRVTAFDQCGMPPTGPRSGRLDALLPAEVTRGLDRLGGVYTEGPGLDLLAAVCDRRVYPGGEQAGLALGECAATHNPSRLGGRPVVNINTAPMALVASVYDGLGVDGIDALLDARWAGRVASPGSRRAPGGGDGSWPLPVSMSTAWAFRIDCRVGGVSRSWWCVYADTGSDWERVQRVAITE